MGLEAECRAWWKGRPSVGKAHLEPAELTFRGDFRLAVPLKLVKAVEAKGGQLRVEWPEGDAVFELGKAAEKWALKIRYPKGRLEKLGVKEGLRVAVMGVEDEAFLEEVKAVVPEVSVGRMKKDCDLIFAGVDSREALAGAGRWMGSLKPGGSLWTVFPKGRKDFRESDVRRAMREAGFVDTKVVGFSETHSSLKWMIPKASRE